MDTLQNNFNKKQAQLAAKHLKMFSTNNNKSYVIMNQKKILGQVYEANKIHIMELSLYQEISENQRQRDG